MINWLFGTFFVTLIPIHPIIWTTAKIDNSDYANRVGFDLVNDTKRKTIDKAKVGNGDHALGYLIMRSIAA
jgi:hypothetical protein